MCLKNTYIPTVPKDRSSIALRTVSLAKMVNSRFNKSKGLESWLQSAGCSIGGPTGGPSFNSQHLHGSLPLSVTPVSGDQTPSSGLWRAPDTQVVHRYT